MSDARLQQVEESLRTSDIRDGQLWQHYKGRVYQIVTTAILEATLTPVVVYRDQDCRTWVRPLEDFQAQVQTDRGPVARFARYDE